MHLKTSCKKWRGNGEVCKGCVRSGRFGGEQGREEQSWEQVLEVRSWEEEGCDGGVGWEPPMGPSCASH